MKKNDLIFAAIIIVVVLAVGSLLFIFGNSGSQSDISKFSSEDQDRPKVLVSETEYDLGEMTNQDIKEKDIEIKNDGNKPLAIYGIRTSCDCTYAYVLENGESSPKFSMHANSNWQKEIGPGENVILRVIYEPAIMPVSGKVTRAVFFQTNDPENPNVTINFEATVK